MMDAVQEPNLESPQETLERIVRDTTYMRDMLKFRSGYLGQGDAYRMLEMIESMAQAILALGK